VVVVVAHQEALEQQVVIRVVVKAARVVMAVLTVVVAVVGHAMGQGLGAMEVAAQSALSGPVQLAPSHQQIQVTYNELIY
jgi:hypothetical protein